MSSPLQFVAMDGTCDWSAVAVREIGGLRRNAADAGFRAWLVDVGAIAGPARIQRQESRPVPAADALDRQEQGQHPLRAGAGRPDESQY